MARNSRRYSAQEREHAVQLVTKLGLAEATNQLGYPKSTIAGWSYQSESQSAAPVTPAKGVQESAAEPVVAKSGKSVAKTYSPSLRAKALEYAAAHGVTKAAKEFGTTRPPGNGCRSHEWRPSTRARMRISVVPGQRRLNLDLGIEPLRHTDCKTRRLGWLPGSRRIPATSRLKRAHANDAPPRKFGADLSRTRPQGNKRIAGVGFSRKSLEVQWP